MNIILQNLKKNLKIAICNHYCKLKEIYTSSHLYGYALYTDEDVSSVGPVANAEDDLQISEEDEFYNYYRYSPDEWHKWDDFGMFDEINEILSNIYMQKTVVFEEVRESILNIFLESLQEVCTTGIFAADDSKRFLVVWVSDSDDDIMEKSACLLNDKKVYDECRSEFEE